MATPEPTVRFPKITGCTRKYDGNRRFVRLRLHLRLVQRLLERVPGQRGAFDPHRKLDDTLEGFQVAQPDALEVGGQITAVTFALELRLVDRHERLEGPDQL